ncbi:hypothetical protein [Burkholderia sp. LMG 21824]|uniref:hypothetical protein n=1 Tax=Burkholderia sp. LMG 21824 TaxID=3158172 RepID=UPI003C2E3872
MRADIALCDANEAFASSDGGHFTQLFDKWEMRGVTPIVEKYEENCFYSELGKNEADIFNVDNFRQSGFNGRISNEVGRMRDP